MSPESIFLMHLVLGYVAWLLCFRVYVLPRLKSMDRVRSATGHRYSAQLPLLWTCLHPSRRCRPRSSRSLRHVRRVLGLGNWVAGYAGTSDGKHTSAVLAIGRRLQFRGTTRPNPRLLPRYPGRPSAVAGQLGSAYVIPVIYVPALMITHFAAFYLLMHPQPKTSRNFAGDAVASD